MGYLENVEQKKIIPFAILEWNFGIDILQRHLLIFISCPHIKTTRKQLTLNYRKNNHANLG